MLLTQELKDLKLENLNIDEELANQQTARELLEKQEEEYWKQYSHHKQQLLMAEDEYRFRGLVLSNLMQTVKEHNNLRIQFKWGRMILYQPMIFYSKIFGTNYLGKQQLASLFREGHLDYVQ